MTWDFGESWDLYQATPNDAVGYWDANSNFGNCSSVAGRFTGGRALSLYGSNIFYKTSNVNDGVHHFVVAMQTSAAISGSTLGLYFQLLDGTTGQCAVVFRSDGAILLTSGTAGGTILSTYAGAFSAPNTWYAFEIEVVIHNTLGAFRVRRNGNSVNDFDSGANLNTRVSVNAYANKLQIGSQGSVSNYTFDDFYWRSGAASVPWIGDIRCAARMPLNDVAVQFSRSAPVNVTQVTGGTWSSGGFGPNQPYYTPMTASWSGTIAAGTFVTGAAATGHVKAAIYDATGPGGMPGQVLATSGVVTNPVNGSNPVTFSPPATVTKGQVYWLAVDMDVALNLQQVFTSGAFYGTAPYSTFPLANPTGLTSAPWLMIGSWIITTTKNADCVNEAQEDLAATYVTDNVVGHNDLYSIAPLASVPAFTVAVVTRGYAQKTDAGTRTGAVQIKSGGTTVQTPAPPMGVNQWTWLTRSDLTDPNTGSAWGAGAVAALQVGPVIVT